MTQMSDLCAPDFVTMAVSAGMVILSAQRLTIISLGGGQALFRRNAESRPHVGGQAYGALP